MSKQELISDEQLNALLDNELDDAERARLFESIRNDKDLSARYCKLRQVKEMVTLSYNDPPLPKNGIPGLSHQRFPRKQVNFYLFIRAVNGFLSVGLLKISKNWR